MFTQTQPSGSWQSVDGAVVMRDANPGPFPARAAIQLGTRVGFPPPRITEQPTSQRPPSTMNSFVVAARARCSKDTDGGSGFWMSAQLSPAGESIIACTAAVNRASAGASTLTVRP